jgi:hypothetical protein
MEDNQCSSVILYICRVCWWCSIVVGVSGTYGSCKLVPTKGVYYGDKIQRGGLTSYKISWMGFCIYIAIMDV